MKILWALSNWKRTGPVEPSLDLAAAMSRRGHEVLVVTGRPIQVRRYLMSKTQHWLYFRVRGNLLEVLSVWATSREAGPKL